MSDSTPEPRTLRSTVRNPRRRQRQSDGDSVQSAPRRKRSKISETTFMPPRMHEEEEEVNGSIEVASTANGHIHPTSTSRPRERPRKGSASMLDGEMTMRAKKTSLKRPMRGDGATTLAQTERYSVKLLPSTPKELRKETAEYRGSLGGAHHALAITRQRAYIWDYTSHAPVSSPKIFDVPFPAKPTDPLPHGVLVPAGNSAELGLLLVSATSGDVVYYDSIERATSLNLFQGRGAGAAGSLGSLFSGEIVVDLVSAELAGYVAVLSSGRLVHMTLRDGQGRPRVAAQFLRSTEQASSGIFGSIRGILTGGSWRKDVTAVHTRALSPRGPVQAISLTSRAELQIWDIGWNGQYTFDGSIDCRELLVNELRGLLSPEMGGKAEGVVALDFALLDRPTAGNQALTTGTELPLDIVVLLQYGSLNDGAYVLAQLSLINQEAAINHIVELRPTTVRKTQRKPRLLIPKPQKAAFVIFEDTVLVAELGQPDYDSPEAQLHASYVQPSLFEDSICLKQDACFLFLGAAEEHSKTSHASSVAFVQGAGLVRIVLADDSLIPRLPTTPIKTLIEQAVFHGELQEGNIIDFSRQNKGSQSLEVIEEAALQISAEILSSTSTYISTDFTSSLEDHLAYKARVLRALVAHVRQTYTTTSRSTMWQLLWDAEKVAAGQHLWKAFEEHKEAGQEREGKRTATVMDELCALAIKSSADEPDIPSSNDTVRDYFIYRLQYVQRLLKYAYDFLKMIQQDSDYSPLRKVRLTIEADDVWSKALEAVLAFRRDNATAYGISPEFLDAGIMTDVSEYAELPEFWTSSDVMLKAAVGISRVSRELATHEFEDHPQEEGLEALAREASIANPQLVQLMCLIFQERINWLESRNEEKQHERAGRLRQTYADTRYDNFTALVGVSQVEAGLSLAEKYHDMHTLTQMIVMEYQYYQEALLELPRGGDRTPIEEHLSQMDAKVGKYFRRFGDDWANAYFDATLCGGKAGHMFDQAQEHWQKALTKYLRAEPSRAKLCWINDITSAKDFSHASETLAVAARDQENMLWAKKVELSMSKLALLATQEEQAEKGVACDEHDSTAVTRTNDLEIVYVQTRLYNHLAPEVEGMIDHEAELQVAMEKVGSRDQDLHSLRQLLEHGLNRLLQHVALTVDELIDVLTLMESLFSDEDEDRLEGLEFYLALIALNAAAPSMPQERVDMLLQLIWKRCYVYDNWVEINSLQKVSEDETSKRLMNTTTWRTLFYAMDRNLFDGPTSYVRHFLPSECLGAACSADDLSYRWPEPDLLDAILRDNRIHDEQLQVLVTDRRLDQWVEQCVIDANAKIQEASESEAKTLQTEREFAASVAQGEGHSNGIKTNGHVKGLDEIKVEDDDSEVEGADVDDDDEDVDVEMV